MIDYTPDTQSESKYDAFLYEAIVEQDNGTPISVLTALTRGNHDPWEEAARLAGLSPDRAQRALVELLNESVGRKLSFAEMESTAKRLLPLLPPKVTFVRTVSNVPVTADAARQLTYWLLWFGFVVMLILVQAHDRASVVESERLAADDRPSAMSETTDNVVESRRSSWIVNRATGDRDQ